MGMLNRVYDFLRVTSRINVDTIHGRLGAMIVRGTKASTGGSVTVQGGPASGTNANGGSVYVKSGIPSGTGLYGLTALGTATGLNALAYGLVRSTVASSGTVSDAQHRGMVLYQDASGGSVTMTTRTGTQIDAAFPDLVTGMGIPQWMASNHASNTSTISGGTGVTLVGSGAVTQTGGMFFLIKTGTATYDMVRVA